MTSERNVHAFFRECNVVGLPDGDDDDELSGAYVEADAIHRGTAPYGEVCHVGRFLNKFRHVDAGIDCGVASAER